MPELAMPNCRKGRFVTGGGISPKLSVETLHNRLPKRVDTNPAIEATLSAEEIRGSIWVGTTPMTWRGGWKVFRIQPRANRP